MTYQLGPTVGKLVLRTSRTGLGRRAGHDLTIEATVWSGAVDAENPSVTVEVRVAGLVVREGTGGLLPLTDADRAEIQKTLRKILQAQDYPTITFASTAVSGSPELVTVEGELTVMGTTRAVTVQARRVGSTVSGSASVVQSRWGIKPFSAFLGALRLADEVVVAFDLDLDTASA